MLHESDPETTFPLITIPPRVSFASLPNECLKIILDHVSDDFRTLRALLTVNWRLFHASARRLIDTKMQSRTNLILKRKEVELILVSALTHHDPPATSFEAANAILLPHGLRLSSPLPGSLMAEIIAKGTKTTTDYSRLFIPYSTCSTRAIPFLSMWPCPEGVILAFKIDQEVPHQAAHEICKSYDKAFIRGLRLFLLDHNAEDISEMSFDINLAAEYLKVRNRMARLTALTIIAPHHMDDSSLQDAVQFIRDNQAAFPGNAKIDLTFYKLSWITSNQQKAIARFHGAQYALYEALGQPKRIQRIANPLFYTMCNKLDVSKLESFEDEDGDVDPADHVGRQMFLLSIPTLVCLSLLVDTPRIFDGIVTAHPEGQPGDPKPLPALRRLRLLTKISQNVLAPIHDMATLCGATLEHLRVVHLLSWDMPLYETVAEPKIPLERLVLGNWTFPALRELSISLWSPSWVRLGSLDECRSLVSLRLQITLSSSQSHLSRPPFEVALAPKWCLPRLKYLSLENYAALLFNYDSLETMPSLETLHLSVVDCTLDWLVKKVPRLSKHFILTDELARQAREEARGVTAVEETTEESQGLWTHEKWNLPKLREIRLSGLPALVFSLDWLYLAPNLVQLSVGKTSDDSRVTKQRYMQNGKRFLKAIMAADMCSDGEEDREARTCPRKLVSVISKFKIGKKAASKLGLARVTSENMKKYRALGTRVYEMGKQYLIRKSDRRR
ncbi:hypothetical protein BGZ93_009906, partial [Podila epicladia]